MKRIVALVVVVTGALAGCGGGDTASNERPLVVGYSFGFDVGDVGDRLAFRRVTQETGVRIRTRDMGSQTNAIAALLRGDVDLVNAPYISVAQAVASGAPLRVVLGANMAPEFLLAARPGISSLEDLRGKVVVHSGPGTATETLVKAALRSAGLAPRDVRMRGLQESPQKAAALISGRADAAAVEFVDYRRLLRELPGATVLARQSDLEPRAAVMVWATTEKATEEDGELLRKVVSGMLAGYDGVYRASGRREWIRTARSDALEGSSPLLARDVYEYYRGLGFWPRRTSPVTRAQHERLMRYWHENDLLEGDVRFGDVWDDSFWRQASQASRQAG